MKYDNCKEGIYNRIFPEDTSGLLLPEDLADYKIEDNISGNTMYIFGAKHLSPEIKKMLGIKE